MSIQKPSAVRAFISYSWSSASHQEWVLALSARLVADGIDVILDKWELQPGRDPIAFMEQMVTNRDVGKVLMICDRIYTEKANGREGGVGKEAQILTAEIYEKTAQDKYAAIITERDDEGKPYVPAYYHSKQYIDFTEEVKIEEKYQELLRWLYDKPQHVKPKLGAAPSFITAPDEVTTATTSKLKQAEHAIKSGSASASGAIADFGDALVDEFASLRPSKDTDEPWDEVIMRCAAAMRPGLRNLGELVLAEARYGGSNFVRILGIYEGIGKLMYRPPEVRSWSDEDYDAYKMICYEAFLCMIAIALREQRFDLVEMSVNHPYLIAWRERNNGPSTTTFRVFCQDIPSFRQRKSRIGSNLIDLYADLTSELYKVSFPSLDQIFQADLILFLRGQVVNDNLDWQSWWPRTLLYANSYVPTELFARSESLSFFSKWAPKVFGAISVADLNAKVAALHQDSRQSWGGAFRGPNIVMMTNAEHLGSKP